MPSLRQFLALCGRGLPRPGRAGRRRVRRDADPAAERPDLARRPRSSTSTTARPRSAGSASRTASSSRWTRCPTTCRRRCSRPRTAPSTRTAASRRPASRGPSGTTCAAAPPRAARRSPSSTRRTPTSPQERTYTRKIKEFFIAVKLARRDDKDKILEDYLNTIYFGRGAYGIQTAAQTYFGKDGQRAHRRGGRGPRRGDPVAGQLRPGRRRGAAAGPVRLRARRHGGQGLARGRASAAGMQVPKLAEAKKPRGGTDFYLMDTVRRELKANGLHRPGHRPRRAAGDLDVRPALAAGSGARGAPGAAAGERAQRAHRPVGGAAGDRCGRRDVRRRGGRPAQRGHPGPGAARLGVQGVRAERGAARRHQPEEPVLGQLAARGAGDRQGGQQRVRQRLRLVGRPGDRHRGVHQHRLRRPVAGDGRRARWSTRPSRPGSRRTPRG